ncbi:MAG: recombinase family protein, partial [Oscillospiraceae bacterium]|nr:recombinase family protein [Oscillospiraceae bacterium]
HNHAKGYNKQVTQNLYWQPNTVRSILLDRVYIGDMVQGKSKTVNGKQRNLAPDEWICVPNTHKAIVSRDIFERVGRMADEIRTRASEIKKTQYTPNLFLGKVLCTHCNRPMRRKRQNKDGTYWYRCDSQDKHGKNACTVVSVKEAEITSAVMEYLRRQTAQVLGKYVTLEKTVTVPDDAADSELREINRALNNAGRFLKSLYENMVSDIITPDEYTQMKGDYEAKIEALSDRADEIRRQHRKAKTDRDNHYKYADAVSAAVCDFALTPEIADAVIQKIVVHKDKTFEVFYRFNDETKEPSAPLVYSPPKAGNKGRGLSSYETKEVG